MPVDIHKMRSEVSFQPPTPAPNASTGGSGTDTSVMDPEQLREAIREVVLEIVSDEIYTMFRTSGRR